MTFVAMTIFVCVCLLSYSIDVGSKGISNILKLLQRDAAIG
jgi:branched-subunit amino acid transport protein AzlD